jgi:hypothetical protein
MKRIPVNANLIPEFATVRRATPKAGEYDVNATLRNFV